MLTIENRPSPNFGERKNGAKPEYIILHFTAMDSAEEACIRLCDPEFEVSSHYLIDFDGTIIQLVDEDKRAWHAGLSFWAGEGDLNSRSIGIEIANNGARPFENAQYDALEALIREIRARWNIPANHVLGHSDIAMGRKFDPGPWFDWPRLDQAGATCPPRATLQSEDFRELAASAGYQADAELDALILAVRLRNGAYPLFGPMRQSDLDLLNLT